MKLYDSIFNTLSNALKEEKPRIFAYDAQNVWPQNPEYEMILQNSMAYELGSSKYHSANMTCITDNASFIEEDAVYLYGPDLREMTGGTDYVRVSEILLKEENLMQTEISEDTGKLYNLIQDIDFVKYHVYTKGFMLRTSGQSVREQVRVSHKALQNGISFAAIGNAMISHYKKNPHVAKAKVIFITANTIDYELLEAQAKHAMDIKNSLSMIQKGLPTECAACSIKEICSEIEGLRELHFGKKDKASEERYERPEISAIL